MRKRHKKSEMPFAEALEFARKRLAKAKKERQENVTRLALLDREIPDLERTIHALDQQLRPAQLVHMTEVSRVEMLEIPSEPLFNTVEGVDEDELLPDAEGTELIPE